MTSNGNAGVKQNSFLFRLIKSFAQHARSVFRRYRLAVWGATAVILIPAVTLVCDVAVTGFPQSWGPFGRVTIFPGRLICEEILGVEVYLAATHTTYLAHVKVWSLLLATSFAGWVVLFVAATEAVKWLGRSGAAE